MRSAFNRTLAIALAAGVSVTGLQAIAPTGTTAAAQDIPIVYVPPLGAEPPMLPNTTDSSKDSRVYFDTTIEGHREFGVSPRFYTLNQARVIAATEQSVEGYVLNASSKPVYHGKLDMVTRDASDWTNGLQALVDNRIPDDAPRYTVNVSRLDRPTGTQQNELQHNGRIDLRMAIYPEPGTWAADLQVYDFSMEDNKNVVTGPKHNFSLYTVADVSLGYEGKTVKPGQTVTIPLKKSGPDADKIPAGTTYELDGNFSDYEGWNVSIDKNTGDLTVTLAADAPEGTNINIPVTAMYKNAAGKIIGTPDNFSAVVNSNTPVIKEVRNNSGVYTLYRTDGTSVNVSIDTTGDVTGAEIDGDGNLVLIYDNGTRSKPIDLPTATVTEANKGTPNHTITITDTDGKAVTFNAYDNHVQSVEDNGKGVYTLIMRDGRRVQSSIDVSGDVTNVTIDGNGDLILTFRNGTKSNPIKMPDATVTEANKGKPNHTITITGTDGKKVTFNAYDNYVDRVEDNGKGTYTLIMRDGRRVESSIDVSGDVTGVTVDGNGDLVLTFRDGSKSKPITMPDATVTEANKGKPNHTITITGTDGKSVTFNAYDNYVQRVEDNGKGVYTLIMRDGRRVESSIDVSGDVVNIEPQANGDIVLVYRGGTKSKPIPLAQTKLTETGKNTPKWNITIATPDGKKVSFNPFDVYVTDIVKNAEGNYDVYRSDVNGGKTVWRTIDLSDIRADLKQLNDRVGKLEKQVDANTREIAKLKKEIERLNGEIARIDREILKLKGRMDDAEKRLTIIEGDIVTIKNDIAALDVRVTNLEARVTDLEDTRDKWAKCYSGLGLTAIPLALSVPLYALSQTHLPGVEAMNTRIQQQLGIYNEDLARAWAQHGDVLGVAAAALGIAGTIGAIAHISNECRDYNQTDAVQATKLGQLSSKAEAGSSKKAPKATATATATTTATAAATTTAAATVTKEKTTTTTAQK